MPFNPTPGLSRLANDSLSSSIKAASFFPSTCKSSTARKGRKISPSKPPAPRGVIRSRQKVRPSTAGVEGTRRTASGRVAGILERACTAIPGSTRQQRLGENGRQQPSLERKINVRRVLNAYQPHLTHCARSSGKDMQESSGQPFLRGSSSWKVDCSTFESGKGAILPPRPEVPPAAPFASTGGNMRLDTRATTTSSSTAAALTRQPRDPVSTTTDLLCSEEDINKVVNFLAPGDGVINLPQLIEGFRLVRRARANGRYEASGRAATKKLMGLIERSGMDLHEWFSWVDTSQAGRGDGKVTMLELRLGIKRTLELINVREAHHCAFPTCTRQPNYGHTEGQGEPEFCSDHFTDGMVFLGKGAVSETIRDASFTRDDITELLRFIDQDGNYDLELSEIEEAMSALGQRSRLSLLSGQGGAVMFLLEAHLQQTSGRVVDLFAKIDRDGSGTITKNELRQYIRNLMHGSTQERFKEYQGVRQQVEREEARRKLLESMSERVARVERAKRCGAYMVFKRIETWQRTCNMRIIDAFTKAGIDADGSGTLDIDELVAFMRPLNLRLTYAEARRVFSFIDGDSDGEIDPSELIGAMKQLKKDEAFLRSVVESKESLALLRGEGTNTLKLIQRHKQQDGTHDPPGNSSKRLPCTASQKLVLGTRGGATKLMVASGSMLDGRWLQAFDSGIHRSVRLTRY